MSGFFGYSYLSFISGCFSTLSLLFLHFSAYAMKESKERNDIVNRLLEKLDLDDMVDISTERYNSSNVQIPIISTNNKNVVI